MLQLVKVDPSNDDWRAGLADVEVRLGTAEQGLGKADGAALSTKGVATLKEMGQKHSDTVFILDMEIDALLTARPIALRDPKLAVEVAEHEVLLTRRHEPRALLSLAEAYRAEGRIEEAHAAAREGLALLLPGTPHSCTRTLLNLAAK